MALRSLLIGLLAALAASAQAPAPPPPSPHFPDRLHAYVWRNWTLVPTDQLAAVVGAKPGEIAALGTSMGLPAPAKISDDQWRRSYITIIRRNWLLLPREQIRDLLGWTDEKLEFTLREDDFLWAKLGYAPPGAGPLRWTPPDEAAKARAKAIAAVVREEFPGGIGAPSDPPFAFVGRLSSMPAGQHVDTYKNRFTPRYCYSYFALYGDPLLEPELDPYPDGYLARLRQAGVDGVWMQGVLAKLSPFPWDPARSEGFEARRKALNALVARARKQGIGVYLYLNEPRAMPVSFFAERPGMKGVVEGDYAALCTSNPEALKYLTDGVESLCRAVPGLAGIFTISYSENLTHCWSHRNGAGCARCAGRPQADVIAEVNGAVADGIRKSGTKTRLIAWDWVWPDDAAPGVIAKLPADVALQSVSEWDLPLERGGVKTSVGEYSISAVGPGPRALRLWEMARKRGMKTIAKIQAGNTWECSAVPYIPAVANVARHAANLAQAGVDGLMLGWTLGGYPSPNLEVVAELGRPNPPSPEEAMLRVARRRFGEKAAPAVVKAWTDMSAAFQEFPFSGQSIYTASYQTGPSNPLWEVPTGRQATMVGYPFDDLQSWRSAYPEEAFIGQMRKVAVGFERGAVELASLLASETPRSSTALAAGEGGPLREEVSVATACALHFGSVVDQSEFVRARRALAEAKDPETAKAAAAALDTILRNELARAKRLYEIQSADSRIGYEASNHYYYVPLDLVEKAVNCRDLLDRWLPAERAKRP